MSTLAILFDDRSLYEPWRLFLLCVYCPALVISASWLLIRFNRKLVLVALVVSVAASFAIVSDLRRDLERTEIARRTHPEFAPIDPAYVRAAWFAAAFPPIMAVVFFAASPRRPNQPPVHNALTRQ
jgi:hypothetical protein